MSELIRVDTEELKIEHCGSCKYSTTIANGAANFTCSYCEHEGHSRIYANGKRAVPKGYCDKWEPKKVREGGAVWQQVY